MSSAFFRRPVWPCISRAGLSIAALFILFASLVLGWSANAADEPRTALVIGNGAYSYGSLANAVTDATDMADALRDVGFEVTLLTDADQRAMDKALTGFSDALSAKGGVGLLYYSGHGVQVDNENYALPIGDELKREDDVKYEAVNIGQVITNLSKPATASTSSSSTLAETTHSSRAAGARRGALPVPMEVRASSFRSPHRPAP